MQNVLEVVGIITLVGGVIAVTFIWQKKQVDKLREQFANDPDIEVPSGWVIRMNTRPPHRPGHVIQAGGGKNNPARWDLVSEAKDLALRTTLSLSREGAMGGLREMFGMKDVHIGDGAFDKTYTIRGSDSDSVRGIVSQHPVMAAVDELFNLGVWSFDVNKRGVISVRAPRSRLDGDHAKALLLATVRLAEVLDQNSSQPAVSARVA